MADKKRRDKGDGCISQRADGTWTARIRVGLTPEGKPKIKAFYGKSEREVKKKLKEFEKELHKNDMSVVQKGTVESYMLPNSYSRLASILLIARSLSCSFSLRYLLASSAWIFFLIKAVCSSNLPFTRSIPRAYSPYELARFF